MIPHNQRTLIRCQTHKAVKPIQLLLLIRRGAASLLVLRSITVPFHTCSRFTRSPVFILCARDDIRKPEASLLPLTDMSCETALPTRFRVTVENAKFRHNNGLWAQTRQTSAVQVENKECRSGESKGYHGEQGRRFVRVRIWRTGC